MKSDFDFPRKDLLGPVVFRPSFNGAEDINGNQAWSLFFSGGQEDKLLGTGTEAGRFFTNLLVAAGISGVLWATFFTSSI
jgi:hypothetical protein